MTNEMQTQVVCPYCGHAQAESPRCESCRGLFEPLSRQATQNAMGPWFIRDETQPFRPGCSYETLLRLIERGRVTAETILRGPTTHQFWMRADHVPGLAHLMGRCHACGERVGRGDVCCEFCGVMFGVEAPRDALGLLPVRDLDAMAGAMRSAPAAERERRLESVGYDRLRAAVEAGPAAGAGAAAEAAPDAPLVADSLVAAVEESGDLAAPRQVRRRRIRREELTAEQLAAEQRRRERRMLIVKGSIAAATILLTALLLLWVLIKAGALALPFHVPGTGPREPHPSARSDSAPGVNDGEESEGAAPPTPSPQAGDEGAGEATPPDEPPPVAAAEPDPAHAELLELYREGVRLVDGTTLAELERAEAIFNRVERELPSEAHPDDLAAQQRKVARRLERLRDDPADG